MKTANILIPTDLSLETLNTVTGFLDKNPGHKFNISLVHFLQLSDSISELLMLSRRSREYTYISSEFEDRIRYLRKQYADQITFIHTEFFYGSTVAVFKNFLEHKNIDMIVMLHGHNYAKITPNSIDPNLLIQRSGYPLLSISSQVKQAARVIERVMVSKLAYDLL